MKLRTNDPWMPAADYSASLSGFTVNILVEDMTRALEFQRDVLGGTIVYDDPDFAVCRHARSELILHADHTYDDHPFRRESESARRGLGVELRVHQCDPDNACDRARALGYEILCPPETKGHGLREAYLRDADGYVWVPDVPRIKGR